MFSIEEAKANRPAATVNIPASACREFEKDAVARAIEEKVATGQAETSNVILSALVQVWNKLRGIDAIAAQPEDARR